MPDDIVKRLRSWADMFKGGYAQKLTREAADEIERLRRLIHEWSDANNFWSLYGDDLTKAVDRAIAAEEMLRKEARRG